MANFIIGLTGGIGSGKTTVANLFAEQGIVLVDADIIAREVVAKGSDGLKQIGDKFGPQMLTPDGCLDRAALREQIFHHPQDREWLNALLHPMIRTRMLEQLEMAASPYVIMVVPLLFENGLDKLADRTLVVDISPKLQLQRTIERDMVSKEQVQNIINSQSDRQSRLDKADDVIDNQGEIDALQAQVLALHNKYLQLADIKNS
ncbi:MULTISPECIES: dephospho-CoA kinase [Shewanella]|jgi:dephospho-CoA kinase|uniref:Dephospho-CoA kinase n=2 Tax=Shewanella TaxID=22 RepID=A0ABX5PPI8_9GAMM|nr:MULTISPECIES: dephospho-CoA kinase [Shewanella]MBZ4677930.1 dephospho-CoA kinase [Shewanella sp.]MCE9850787.1 dephospho-CoA kinase [Shewanella chilikensis]MCL1154367.1 dephospho-CoA kinase [Shewanella chilikensis]MCL1164024.1 dephospho-CoA kinase [Shewanella chilikensis]PYE58985.1 dephospho-CoA kinase [Shewanella chilikensis]